jgi:hypothetical protein
MLQHQCNAGRTVSRRRFLQYQLHLSPLDARQMYWRFFSSPANVNSQRSLTNFVAGKYWHAWAG